MVEYDVQTGDCVEVLAALPAGVAACVIADPPYGVTKLAWDKPMDWPAVWAQLHRVTPPTANLILFAQHENRFLRRRKPRHRDPERRA